MKKLIFFIPLFLFALRLDFSICYKKFKHIDSIIPVTKTKSVTFSKPDNYIFYDPFTKMYVISHKNKYPIVFHYAPKLGWLMAGIKKDEVFGGTYARDAAMLNKMALLSVKAPKNSVISDIFCRAYGVGNGYFVPTRYLKHFVKYGYWGDVGFEVDNNFVVKYVDPFYVEGIKPGDKIVKINSKKASVKTYEKYILFNRLNTPVIIQTQNKTIKVKIRKKLYDFTPLEYFGIKVNEDLVVTQMPETIKKKFFSKSPVKIYAVNDEKITSYEQLKKVLSYTKNVTITFEQNGLKIKVPLRR